MKNRVSFAGFLCGLILAGGASLAQVNPDLAAAYLAHDPAGDLAVGRALTVEAVYTHASDVAVIRTCELRLDHPQYPVGMTLDRATGQVSLWSGDGGAHFLYPPGVVLIASDTVSLTVRWSVLPRANWPTVTSGAGFSIRAGDDGGGFGAWSSAGLDLAFEPAECGATVIIHGRNSDVPQWALTMGQGVAARRGTGRVWRLDPASVTFGAAPVAVSGDPDTAGEASEEVFVMDWTSESNEMCVPGFSEAAADAFVAALVRHQQAHPVPHFLDRLHLIGHSRGPVVASEMAERLLALAAGGETFAVDGPVADWVDVTALDPHPVWGDQGFLISCNQDVDRVNSSVAERDQVQAWTGLAYADNYYQPVSTSPHLFNPDGMWLHACINRNLDATIPASAGDSSPVEHSDVHAWYYGTINPDATDDELLKMINEERAWRRDALAGKVYGTGPADKIAIDRSGWYFDGRGIAAGYGHAPAGGGLMHRMVNPLTGLAWGTGEYWTDPATPPATEWDPALDNVFNGTLTYVDGSATIPGWERQGGGGSGTVVSGRLRLGGANLSRTHNFLHIPDGAAWLAFDLAVTTAGGDTLTVTLNRGLPDAAVIAALALADAIPGGHQVAVPATFRGKPATIDFRIGGGDLSLDDIRLVVTAGLPGDLNQDGVLDSLDVALLAGYLAGNVAAGEGAFIAPAGMADVNDDGVIDTADLVTLLILTT
ncbi:MAG: dockerin type I repeat-containing protein [Acidobacteria bacterium]|nr:dockerin type I repeat-containing protein [Acidobacteriota bacterium]